MTKRQVAVQKRQIEGYELRHQVLMLRVQALVRLIDRLLKDMRADA